ncbi:MAG: hypothetical protein ACMZI0_15605 [Symbiopectobacterium sp.]|uniref:hypothetical protein n=1 Tax=Symbiopectobacterium sp. TaxID=2952789 RepID=UPI0039E7D57A
MITKNNHAKQYRNIPLLLSLRAHFTHSLTSAVELAKKTKSPKHIVFAEKLLKIKRAAPDTHLESLTRYKEYLCCPSRMHEKRIREDKYQHLAEQLNRVKQIRLFLDGSLPTEETPEHPVDTLRRAINQHLTQAYNNTPRVYAIKASISAISQNIGRKKRAVNVESSTHLSTDIHAIIDAGKPLGDIANRVIDFKVYHRLNSQP